LRILHTSDWHLGKKLFKKERMPEQVLFLQWLLLTIEERKPQVLVIAGDVFDTPIPTTESLSVFFQFSKD
jgi:exonuclease SbcD